VADGPTGAPKLKVHQTLHGYADGHTQLASSVALSSRDAKSVLSLSDAASSSARLPPSGYLTGYPLRESGYYALAKTWPATEMPRPGCVWTHTLLIEMADLAAIPDLSPIEAMFRRPEAGSNATYAQPLAMPPQGGHDDPLTTPMAEAFARQLLIGLYRQPSSKIVISRPLAFDGDQLVLKVWSQQWPRLRRTFRFCTAVAADRSTDSMVFDLQYVLSGDVAPRTRFADAINAEHIPPDDAPWLRTALDDLRRPSAGLRKFLRAVGGESEGGRAAFIPLIELFVQIHRPTSPSEHIAGAVEVADRLGGRAARRARGMLVEHATAHAASLDDQGFGFLLDNLSLLPNETLARDAGKLGSLVAARAPEKLLELFEAGGGQATVAAEGIRVAGVPALLDLARSDQALVDTIVELRPDVLEEPNFWRNTTPPASWTRTAARTDKLPSVLQAISLSGRSDHVHAAVELLGAEAVWLQLPTEGGVPEGWKVWLSELCREPAAISRLFLQGVISHPNIVLAVARAGKPEWLPNIETRDPWAVLAPRKMSTLSDSERQYLEAFLLARALSGASAEESKLAVEAFEPILMKAASRKLQPEAWNLLDARLAWPLLWFNWDNAARVATGVVDLFVAHGLEPAQFLRLTDDDDLFAALVGLAARTSAGRQYLASVRKLLKASPQARKRRQKDLDRALR